MIAMPFHPSNAYTIEELTNNLSDILADCEARARVSLGEKAEFSLKNKVRDGKLYINGEFVEEPFLEEGTITYDFAAVTLGEDEYFVMGDNRTNSLDSRKRGPFPKSAILGKYAYVYFPWDRWRAVTDGK